MTYFVIRHTEDGGVYIRQIEKDKLLKVLDSGDFGDDPKFIELPWNVIDCNRETVDKFVDIHSLPAGYILIRGEIVFPEPVDVVKKYTVE